MPNPTERKPMLEVWDKEASPYHPGEVALHNRVGRAERQEMMARRIHRTYMIDQHREFFAMLPFVVAGSVDAAGAPWASALFGTPGFLTTPDERRFAIDTPILEGDPFAENAKAGAPVSFVGIELQTRRRNRLNAIINSSESADGHFEADVVQSFGNCPQYIHTRDMAFTRDPNAAFAPKREVFESLGKTERAMIARADTFFVASHNPVDDPRISGGVDVNHRGGNPGFVKIKGDTLTVPDFSGNFAFNTLGNFVVNPKAGLLFIDFKSGDILQLTGTIEMLWEMTPEIAAFEGAKRAWRLHLTKGQRLVGASPLTFVDGEASPRSLQTGTWS